MLGHIGESRHAALDIDEEHFDGPRCGSQFLLEKASRHGNAVPHEDLIGRATDSREGDPPGARFPGIDLDSGVRTATASISDNSDSWPWTMMLTVSIPMTPRLAVATDGKRRSEEDVRHLGGNARPAPTVGQGRLESV
jgi:hypothetical protein